MLKPLVIADRTFTSRLFLGTGKFASPELMCSAIDASETQLVTVALRRVNLNQPDDHILSVLNPKNYLILPNTSGARSADEAIRLARLARAGGLPNWVKLEVIPDPVYLLPDGEETLKATTQLVKEGFVVLPYIQPDPILAKKLEDAGASAVMPLASPIGSNKGLRSLDMLRIIIDQALIPVVIDAGLGAPSHATLAMELGASAVLVNTAIATASDPPTVARAFMLATQCGRMAFESGLAQASSFASPSSPLQFVLR
ncbi:MAG: thiazole synthase [Candidatus Margulisiibacteriota bacterium]